jgi:hypothetical protein
MKLNFQLHNAEIKNGRAMPPIPHTLSWLCVQLITHGDNLPFIEVCHKFTVLIKIG